MGALGSVQDFNCYFVAAHDGEWLSQALGHWSDRDQHVNGVLSAKEFKMKWGQGSRWQSLSEFQKRMWQDLYWIRVPGGKFWQTAKSLWKALKPGQQFTREMKEGENSRKVQVKKNKVELVLELNSDFSRRIYYANFPLPKMYTGIEVVLFAQPRALPTVRWGWLRGSRTRTSLSGLGSQPQQHAWPSRTQPWRHTR